jgi:hypothetical protein
MRKRREYNTLKTLVVFDSSGTILAAHQPFLESEGMAKHLKVAFVPRPNLEIAELEIPAEHRSKSLREIVQKFKVEGSASMHRLTLKQ